MNSKVRMKKLTSVVLPIIIVGTIFGVGYAISCNQAQASCEKQEVAQYQPVVELAPRYFTYSSESLAYAKKQGKTVLYFWAPWCTSCASLDSELQNQDKVIPEDVTVLRLEYGKNIQLERKYGVTTQHTFVQVNDKDEKITLWVGGELKNFEKYLQ